MMGPVGLEVSDVNSCQNKTYENTEKLSGHNLGHNLQNDAQQVNKTGTDADEKIELLASILAGMNEQCRAVILENLPADERMRLASKLGDKK
ncbi:MAG: hypothetical protein JEZ07_02425 [Phycisphaerae bacterium]|nr:hypothetical protein [Phycisphaerae bacterium]